MWAFANPHHLCLAAMIFRFAQDGKRKHPRDGRPSKSGSGSSSRVTDTSPEVMMDEGLAGNSPLVEEGGRDLN